MTNAERQCLVLACDLLLARLGPEIIYQDDLRDRLRAARHALDAEAHAPQPAAPDLRAALTELADATAATLQVPGENWPNWDRLDRAIANARRCLRDTPLENNTAIGR